MSVDNGQAIGRPGSPREWKASQEAGVVNGSQPRPVNAESRCRSVTARVTVEEYENVQAAAKAEGLEVSVWLRRLTLRKLQEGRGIPEQLVPSMLLRLWLQERERDIRKAEGQTGVDEFRGRCGEVLGK